MAIPIVPTFSFYVFLCTNRTLESLQLFCAFDVEPASESLQNEGTCFMFLSSRALSQPKLVHVLAWTYLGYLCESDTSVCTERCYVLSVEA